MTPTTEKRPTLPQLIANRQDDLGLKDQDVALAMGYDSPKVIAMIKAGTMRLPINKARLLADVLQVEPRDVMRIVLRDASPDLLTSIEACYGPMALSPHRNPLDPQAEERSEGSGGGASLP